MTPTAQVPSASPSTTHAGTGPCEDGRLTIGDLLAIETEWTAGLEEACAPAAAWQPDARLVRLAVGCQLLEPGYRWQGTFYSEAAQSFFDSDTGQTEPAEVDPAQVPTLPVGGLSFHQLHRSLARAGYGDDRPLSATNGVEIRLNSFLDPFGPPDAPKDVVYFHVAVDDQGEVKDLFVGAEDGLIYQY